jgi:hypothetical protein
VKFFAIIYDLRQPGRNYNELYEAIKGISGEGNWQHPMESFWVLSLSDYSQKDSESIYQDLRPHIDDNDSLIVLKMDGILNQGWMPKSFWSWIKEKRESQ